MKRWMMIVSALLALTILFGGCGARETVQPSAETTEVSAAADAAETGTDASAPTQTQPAQANPDDPTTQSPAAQTDGSASSTTVDETTAQPTKAGETTTKPGAATTKAGETTTKPGAATTKTGETTTKPGAATTKPGAATTKPGATTTKPGATTTKAGAATTKPGASTTKPAGTQAPVSDPLLSTTKSGAVTTTDAPQVKGNAVQAKVTYLNDAPSDYVSKLTAQKLEDFGITGETQKDVLKHPEKWRAYTIRLDFTNKEAVPVTFYYLDVTDNGKGDVFINGNFSAEIGLNPGAQINERFYLLAKRSDTDGQVLQKINGMSMRLQYAATPEDDEATPAFVYAKVG